MASAESQEPGGLQALVSLPDPNICMVAKACLCAFGQPVVGIVAMSYWSPPNLTRDCSARCWLHTPCSLAQQLGPHTTVGPRLRIFWQTHPSFQPTHQEAAHAAFSPSTSLQQKTDLFYNPSIFIFFFFLQAYFLMLWFRHFWEPTQSIHVAFALPPQKKTTIYIESLILTSQAVMSPSLHHIKLFCLLVLHYFVMSIKQINYTLLPICITQLYSKKLTHYCCSCNFYFLPCFLGTHGYIMLFFIVRFRPKWFPFINASNWS